MIESFRGEHRWLSNFTEARVYWLGYYWPTVEHAYQASKATTEQELALIIEASSPGRAKRRARLFKTLPEGWEQRRVIIMRRLLEQKFRIPEYRTKLLATGTEHIQEGNAWGDTFWGVCMRTGEGSNTLGRLIMEIRTKLQEE